MDPGNTEILGIDQERKARQGPPSNIFADNTPILAKTTPEVQKFAKIVRQGSGYFKSSQVDVIEDNSEDDVEGEDPEEDIDDIFTEEDIPTLIDFNFNFRNYPELSSENHRIPGEADREKEG